MSGHDALCVANILIKKRLARGAPPLPLAVMKLTYFCQCWMLGLHGRRLFRQEIEAWRYGPAVADVYFALKHYKRRPVKDPIPGVSCTSLNALESDIVDQVHALYGELDATHLAHLANKTGTPWDAFIPGGDRAVIPVGQLRRHYARLAAS